MGKTLYSYWIMKDDQIPNTVVRTSTIPEELGRISYLLTDKTGTLTQNGTVYSIKQMSKKREYKSRKKCKVKNKSMNRESDFSL